MAQSIYITSAEGHSGKSTVALGVLDTLSLATPRVGVFRPIARSTAERDYVLEMLLRTTASTSTTTSASASPTTTCTPTRRPLWPSIVERYKAVEAQCDAVVDPRQRLHRRRQPGRARATTPASPRTSAPRCCSCSAAASQQGQQEQLGSSVARTPDEMRQIADLALAELTHAHGRAVRRRGEPRRSRHPRRDRAPRSTPRPARLGRRTRCPSGRIPEDRFLVAPIDARHPALGRRPPDQGRPGAAHPRGARRRRRRHVDGQRAAAPHRGRRRRHPRRPHRGAARDAAGQRLRHVPVASAASC